MVAGKRFYFDVCSVVFWLFAVQCFVALAMASFLVLRSFELGTAVGAGIFRDLLASGLLCFLASLAMLKVCGLETRVRPEQESLLKFLFDLFWFSLTLTTGALAAIWLLPLAALKASLGFFLLGLGALFLLVLVIKKLDGFNWRRQKRRV